MTDKTIGRPTKHKPEYDNIAYTMCAKHGYTIPQLAEMFNVVESTVNYWIDNIDSFSEALKRGREEFDGDRVENALLRSALGTTVTERIETTDELGDLKLKQLTTKQVAPNITAINTWLNNRRPNRWRNKQEFVATKEVSLIDLDGGSNNDDDS